MEELPARFHYNEDQLELHKIKEAICGKAFLSVFREAVTMYIKSDWLHCQKKSQIILHITWEYLHTGHWKDVNITWRHAYYFASFFKAISQYYLCKNDNICGIKDAIKTCDMGLLLGAPVLDNILTKLVNYYQEIIVSKYDGPPLKKKKVTETESCYPNINLINPVTSVSHPSIEHFKANYFDQSEPVIITGAIDYWSALNKWNIEYIKQVAGCRTVPVEIGSKYTEESWSQKLMLVSEFIDKFIDIPIKNDVGYLAQHELFDQIPELQNDISIPTYCCLGENSDVDINAWFGPKGTVSPLHHDPKHNFLCQVFGKKYVKLYRHTDTPYLYPHGTDLLGNTSKVDVENPDLSQFPNFVNATAMDCILEPGQMLYIPPKLWHYVKSLSTSFSVSFWWE